jgi:hypothetical protein
LSTKAKRHDTRTVIKGPTGSRRIGSILLSSQSVDITQGP